MFESKEVYFDADGRYDVNFSGQTDIEYDYLAQVVVPDANGNYVVNVLYPEGLDLNVLITEDRVEGVTTPGAQVSVVVWDENGEKGTAETTADETGFYSTKVLVGGIPLDIELGDHVGVSNDGHARETFLVMSHESWLQPWVKRVEGIVQGMELPSGGTQGKVDLWNVSEEKWYSQYIWIEDDGRFGADFSEVPEMTETDRIRLWVSDGDGIQQVSTGTTLDLGVSIGNSEVRGYTIADSSITVSLYFGLDGENPMGLLASAGTRADASGFFSTTLMAGSSPVGVTPGNIVRVENGEFTRDYFIGKVDILGDADEDTVAILGPANAVVHVKGFRVGETDLTSYVWVETDLGADGQGEIDLSSQDLLAGDVFEIVTYMEADGVTIQRMRLLFDGYVFLPIITH